MTQGAQVLQLYRNILRLHRQKLPHHMRSLGDAYVKKEFRDHRKAKPEFIQSFVAEWTKYAEDLTLQSNLGQTLGRDLDPELVDNMSDEQKQQLQRLRQEAIARRDNE